MNIHLQDFGFIRLWEMDNARGSTSYGVIIASPVIIPFEPFQGVHAIKDNNRAVSSKQHASHSVGDDQHVYAIQSQ
jgi:hypothetical protein